MTKKGTSFDGGPVGYKRPPAEHQFKKGQKRTGGRAKGQKNYSTIVHELLHSQVAVSENGIKRKVSFKQALLMRARAKALAGSVADVERFFSLLAKLAPAELEPETQVMYIQCIPGDEWE
jgi:hypothetical protein